MLRRQKNRNWFNGLFLLVFLCSSILVRPFNVHSATTVNGAAIDDSNIYQNMLGGLSNRGRNNEILVRYKLLDRPRPYEFLVNDTLLTNLMAITENLNFSIVAQGNKTKVKKPQKDGLIDPSDDSSSDSNSTTSDPEVSEEYSCPMYNSKSSYQALFQSISALKTTLRNNSGDSSNNNVCNSKNPEDRSAPTISSILDDLEGVENTAKELLPYMNGQQGSMDAQTAATVQNKVSDTMGKAQAIAQKVTARINCDRQSQGVMRMVFEMNDVMAGLAPFAMLAISMSSKVSVGGAAVVSAPFLKTAMTIVALSTAISMFEKIYNDYLEKNVNPMSTDPEARKALEGAVCAFRKVSRKINRIVGEVPFLTGEEGLLSRSQSLQTAQLQRAQAVLTAQSGQVFKLSESSQIVKITTPEIREAIKNKMLLDVNLRKTEALLIESKRELIKLSNQINLVPKNACAQLASFSTGLLSTGPANVTSGAAKFVELSSTIRRNLELLSGQAIAVDLKAQKFLEELPKDARTILNQINASGNNPTACLSTGTNLTNKLDESISYLANFTEFSRYIMQDSLVRNVTGYSAWYSEFLKNKSLQINQERENQLDKILEGQRDYLVKSSLIQEFEALRYSLYGSENSITAKWVLNHQSVMNQFYETYMTGIARLIDYAKRAKSIQESANTKISGWSDFWSRVTGKQEDDVINLKSLVTIQNIREIRDARFDKGTGKIVSGTTTKVADEYIQICRTLTDSFRDLVFTGTHLKAAQDFCRLVEEDLTTNAGINKSIYRFCASQNLFSATPRRVRVNNAPLYTYQIKNDPLKAWYKDSAADQFIVKFAQVKQKFLGDMSPQQYGFEVIGPRALEMNCPNTEMIARALTETQISSIRPK